MLGLLAGIPRDIHPPVEKKVLAGTPWPNELMFSTQNEFTQRDGHKEYVHENDIFQFIGQQL